MDSKPGTRPIRFRLRLSEIEYEKLVSISRATGLSHSAILRRVLQPKPAVPDELHEADEAASEPRGKKPRGQSDTGSTKPSLFTVPVCYDCLGVCEDNEGADGIYMGHCDRCDCELDDGSVHFVRTHVNRALHG